MAHAGFWRRFLAIVIDGLILCIPAVLFSLVIPIVGSLLLSILYYPFFMSSSLMGTPGKVLLGLAVVNEKGERITFKQAFIRLVVSWVSGLLLCLGYLIQLVTPRRQTFHDIIAETFVIQRTPLENPDWIGAWHSEFKHVLNIGESKLGESLRNPPESSTAIASLENLHKLFQSGAITEAEYLAKKEELLKKI